MKLYVWKMDVWECHCRYSVVAESLEEAREIILYELTKNKSAGCSICLMPEEPYDDKSLTYDQRMAVMERHYNRGDYVIRNWIRDTEPSVNEEKKLIRG